MALVAHSPWMDAPLPKEDIGNSTRIALLLRRADEDYECALFMLDNGYGRAAVSRAYYVAFNLVEALLLSQNIDPSELRHRQIFKAIESCHENGDLDSASFEAYRKLGGARRKADRAETEDVAPELVADAIAWAGVILGNLTPKLRGVTQA